MTAAARGIDVPGSFARNWPYCFTPLQDGRWLPLSRGCKPLGCPWGIYDYEDFAERAWQFPCNPREIPGDVWETLGWQPYLYIDGKLRTIAGYRLYTMRLARVLAATGDNGLVYLLRLLRGLPYQVGAWCQCRHPERLRSPLPIFLPRSGCLLAKVASLCLSRRCGGIFNVPSTVIGDNRRIGAFGLRFKIVGHYVNAVLWRKRHKQNVRWRTTSSTTDRGGCYVGAGAMWARAALGHPLSRPPPGIESLERGLGCVGQKATISQLCCSWRLSPSRLSVSKL
jgi:hypothetical protein